ncbi:MAG: hypothetical protein M1835_005321 [Candelina submexicana]|nr:MAG: hypothetical protein M1835_005321 [Candelina submexicana]
MTISSGIGMITGPGAVSKAQTNSFQVFIFTSLLFLSGYVLQQQTVHNIQRAIRPPPKPSPKPLPSVVAQQFGDPPGSKGHEAYQIQIATSQPAEGWKKVAYAQVVTDHRLVCNAVMVFGELHRQKSPAERLLLFPKAWADSTGAGDPYSDTSRRLLKRAAKRYGVVLQPIGTTLPGTNEDRPSSYSLASLFSLINYSRVLYLPPSGLLLKASLLDSLLVLPLERPLLAMPAESSLSIDSSSLLLVRPSTAEHDHILSSILSAESSVESPFKDLLSDPAAIRQPSASDQHYPLLAQTSALEQLPDVANVKDFWSSTGYVRISDAGLPGPEFDIPQAEFRKAMPSRPAAKRIWEELYDKFRDHRMDICGLDLEPWRKDV